MNTKSQVAPALYPHVAVINGAIKTTSLKVAEHFGKRHDHVLRDIKKIISQTVGIAEAPKFGETVIERENPSGGLSIKSTAYEMDKDGFVLLVMSYNGEKAMGLKIAYINAFNTMANELHQTQYGLKQLPEPKTKKALPGGLTLDQQDTIKALVKQRAEELPKEKQAGAIIKQWSAIKKKFGCSYKEVAPENFVNILSLLSRLPIEGELLPAPSINNDLIEILTGRIKVLEGELMPKEAEQMPKLTGKCYIKTKIHLDADHLAEMMQEQGLMLVDAKEYTVVRRPEAGKAH